MKSDYLELLCEVSAAITKTTNPQDTLSSILTAFSHFLGMNRGTITLLEPDTGIAKIVASVGLSSKEKARGIYKVGEGITGIVLQTGEPVVIPHIAKDPRFLNKTGSRKEADELSFFCVPIISNSKVAGALSADRNYQKNHSIKSDMKILGITTSIISLIMEMHDLRETDRIKLLEENRKLRYELQKKFQFSEIIGHSDRMVEVLKLLTQVSKSNATVMIRGESGTGKELIANAIHYNSARKNNPFVKVNCSAIPDSLLEGELFGYEKGAFTGANASKVGKFELANTGTIFLDEIGDFPLSTQVKLLRVLQSREVERLGSNKVVKLDVRIIVATNRNLEKDMEDGTFREDLYYRINVFPIFVPPLRKRKTDILLLAEYFLEKYAKENEKDISRITTPAINLLMSYHWPGNVRELENCIERAVIVCDSNAIRGNHLPPTLQMNSTTGEDNYQENTVDFRSLPDAVKNLEEELIIDSLKRNKGNQRKSAKELGVTERILGYKIKNYEISPKIYTAK